MKTSIIPHGVPLASQQARLLALAQLLHEQIIRLIAAMRRREPAGIRRAKEYIERNLAEPLSRAVLARHAGMSVSVFSRQWNQAVGLTVPEYLAQQRVARAKVLLLDSDENVVNVAFTAGFQSVPVFYRTFARLAGCAPADYRRDGVGGRRCTK